MDILKPRSLKDIKEIENELEALKFHFKDINFRINVFRWLKCLYEAKIQVMSKEPNYSANAGNLEWPKGHGYYTLTRHMDVLNKIFPEASDSDSYTGVQYITAKEYDASVCQTHREILFDPNFGINNGEYIWDTAYKMFNTPGFNLWADFLLINNQGEYLARTWIDNVTDRLEAATAEPCQYHLSYDTMHFDTDESKFVYRNAHGEIRNCMIHCDYVSHNGLIEVGTQKIVDAETNEEIFKCRFNGGFIY
ncbi:MAG: hypothetical protein IJ889_00995 [Eubacterium sp.]|nr:hypothetical protein [Eubacterium sp.]MBR2247359.1 hypothetical protein [Bacilli bacterium]